MDTILLTVEDIKLFKGISSNLNEAKDLFPFIKEAQTFDLCTFMGRSFYLKLLEEFEGSPSLPNYSDLFNGSIYDRGDEKDFHEGLKAVLVYHSWARFLVNDGIQSTPSGFVIKQTQYSAPVDPIRLSKMIAQARSGALQYEQMVESFLNLKSDEYPLFKKVSSSRKKGSIKIRKIG